jgi:hypothetical protein
MKPFLLLSVCSLIFCSQLQAADLFLKINKQGAYKVKVSGEEIFSANKQYRFFDLYFGYHQVTVTDTVTKQVVNQATVLLKNNVRTVIELDYNGHFNTVAEVQVFKNNWYTEGYNGPVSNHGNNGNWNNNGGYNNGNYNPIPGVDPATFSQILSYVKADAFDSGKLSRAKEVTKGNPLSAQQVAEITALFTFESNKVDFAKYAYTFTVDKGNYFLVYKSLTFSSSADEVRKFIAG